MDLCAKSGIKYETFLIIHLLYFSTEIKRFIKSIRRQASRSLYIKNIDSFRKTKEHFIRGF